MMLLLAALLASPAPSVKAERQDYEGATVTSYGAMPQVDSGSLFVFARRVTITTADGIAHKLYFFHWGAGTFLNKSGGETYPAIGSVCDFTTVPHDFRTGNWIRSDRDDDSPDGEAIESVSCKR